MQFNKVQATHVFSLISYDLVKGTRAPLQISAETASAAEEVTLDYYFFKQKCV